MSSFVHLHNHTHYSLLDGACKIPDMVTLAQEYNMPAVAITDHGNMFGAIQFFQKVKKAGLKPIIGMEAYIAPRSRKDRSKGHGKGEVAFHLLLLAKNCQGYQNLMKLSSTGYLEGFYYKPRIDKEILAEHHEGLIALSACIGGEVPYQIIHNDYDKAKEAALFYQNLFKDDYYLEIQDHGIPEESVAIKGLAELSAELSIPLVATNDTHYLKKSHAEAHDILLCIQTGKDYEDSKRLKFSSEEIYFKSTDEMVALFKDYPEAISTTLDIADKCDLEIDFKSQHFPIFTVPEESEAKTLDDYFEECCWKGVGLRYAALTDTIKERLNYEMSIIKQMGYSGYFLVVMDFIKYAKTMGIPVGPGRGSAAGSIVSYVLEITNVDPLQYDLLFERFLNPERVSMPDIDIDFCYEQREKVIEYVREKYGRENVCQIITFGSMKSRGVIRDVGRVLKIPYGEVDQIAKQIPQFSTLEEAHTKSLEFRELVDQNETNEKLFKNALILEGLYRHASTHAAGVVIAPGELTNYVPLFKPSDSDDITTQFDMKSLENVGLLKMDFLGLRTLTVIDHALKAIESRTHRKIDIDTIPYDDAETYQIFSNGETVGVFQFESTGMREYLKKLQPESIGDLTAMNALYRPGPMEWIDDFIDRKNGRTTVEYMHPMMASVLEETHGIIVYQEQVMQIASKLAGFSLGGADILRRAMGKKDEKLMTQQRAVFIEGASKNGIDKNKANDIFDLIDKFAGYGFNKSHAACYSIVAYQTAYLKAHYPKEFMAANLTSEMCNTDRIVVLIDECQRMKISILPPDVNESMAYFFATDEGIRFGLGAIKNVGLGAIESIVEGRNKVGKFNSIYDLCENINLRLANKKVFESLIQCGAMDSLEGHRAQLMAVLPQAIQYAQTKQKLEDRGQGSLFDLGGSDVSEQSIALHPELPEVEVWTNTENLRLEKELIGLYISGHPLMAYQDEILAFSSPLIQNIAEIPAGQNARICGIISELRTLYDRKDRPMAFITIEDFTGSVRCIAFADCYEKYKYFIQKDSMVVLVGKVDRKSDDDESTVLASEIMLLENARESFTKKVSIKLKSFDVNQERMNRIEKIFKENPGSCSIYMNVIKNKNEKGFWLKSNKFKINPINPVIKELREILGKENVAIGG